MVIIFLDLTIGQKKFHCFQVQLLYLKQRMYNAYQVLLRLYQVLLIII